MNWNRATETPSWINVMQTADKTGPEIERQRDPKTASSAPSCSICPCLSNAAVHLGGCFFAATMLGAAVRGIWGAVVGACLGLLFGVVAVFSKDH